MNPGKSMRVNRFVLDANIWVSYLITETEKNLIDIIADNDLTIFRCVELLAEISRVLQYSRLIKYNVNVSYALKIVTGITTPYEITYPIKRYILGDSQARFIQPRSTKKKIDFQIHSSALFGSTTM